MRPGTSCLRHAGRGAAFLVKSSVPYAASTHERKCQSGLNELALRISGPFSGCHNAVMDAIVRQAIAKWPRVPACFGWLGLDARGRWYLRDAATQAKGSFRVSKGDWLRHVKLLAFIGRNYLADGRGRWFFQNGPQQVFVELEATPWVWRISVDGEIRSHTDQPATAEQILLDEQGRVYIATAIGLGIVHSLDVPTVAALMEQGRLAAPEDVVAQTLPARFGYVVSPAHDPVQR